MLTKEREEEIRHYHAKADQLTYGNIVVELLAELDRVREENKRWRDTVRDQDNELDDFRAKLDLAVETLEYYSRIAAYWGPQHCHTGSLAMGALDKIRGEK